MYRYRDREGNCSSDSEDSLATPEKLNLARGSSPVTSTGMDLDVKTEAPTVNGTKKRKVNNIWSTVVQEQSINDDLCKVSMNKFQDRLGWERGCESYDFTRKVNDPRPDPDTDEEIDLDYGVSDIENEFEASERNFGESERTKKKSVSKVQLKERPEDAKKIGKDVARRLREPKVELLERCVQVLGRKKVFDLLHMTEDIEESGGMLIANGSRRRTPGGVFLYQLRKDRVITKKEKDYVFEEDRAKFAELKKAHKKMLNKRKKKLSAPKPSKMDTEDSESLAGISDNAVSSTSEIGQPSVIQNTMKINVSGDPGRIVDDSDRSTCTNVSVAETKQPEERVSELPSDVELEEGEIL